VFDGRYRIDAEVAPQRYRVTHVHIGRSFVLAVVPELPPLGPEVVEHGLIGGPRYLVTEPGPDPDTRRTDS
jgi:hypothetical protein